MARRETHIEDCIRLLDEGYNHVHAFLDQVAGTFFPIPHYDAYHRSFLHNSYGMKLILEKWGTDSYVAGKIHIVRDMDVFVTYKEFRKLTLNEIEKVYGEAIMLCNRIHTYSPGFVPDIISDEMFETKKGLVAIHQPMNIEFDTK